MQLNTSNAPAAVIEAIDVGKTYPPSEGRAPFTALQGASLTVTAGEFVSLIGPSGCGKTTLLKMIDGLIPYDEGELRVMGKPVTGPGPERAVVFQNFALLPWMTILDNVAFGLRLRGTSKEERDAIARRNIEMVGLAGFDSAYPRQLSGGMQQRVGLARALSVDPDVLLMDEPFGSLDAQTRNLMQADLLRVWNESRKTVVFVTHAMDEAVFLSDRVVVMATRPGRVSEIIDIDLPRPRTDETRTHPRFVELTSYVWDRLREMILTEPEQKSA